MAHNLNYSNGRYNMFYYGDTPWHGYGKKLETRATAAIALQEAGLDYTVTKLPNHHFVPKEMGGKGEYFTSPDSFSTVRTDTGQVLGSRVGPGYTVLQNADALNFLDPIVERDEAIYETAGALGKGEVIWLLAKLPEHIRVRVNGKDDEVKEYVLLANSHNGSMSAVARFTPIRVVCNNTLSAALRGKSDSVVRVSHTSNIKARIEQAYKTLGLYNKLAEQLAVAYQRMADTKVADAMVRKTLASFVPKHDEDSYYKAVLDELVRLYHEGQGSELACGTAWGIYNAVTEYADHVVRGDKDTKGRAERLTSSAWFGQRADMKDQAFKQIMQLVEIER